MPEQETSRGVIVRTARRYSNPYGTHRCSIEFQSVMRPFLKSNQFGVSWRQRTGSIA